MTSPVGFDSAKACIMSSRVCVAPLFVDVIADASGLEVGDDHLIRIAWTDESAVELRDRQQLLVANGINHGRIQPIAPIGRCSGLLMNCHAFGEPARHPVIRRRQNVDVAQFVPQRAGPMKGPWPSAGRAVHRDDCPERYAERA